MPDESADESGAQPCYIGRAKCGCIYVAVVAEMDSYDTPVTFHKRMSKTLAEMEREGLQIERVPCSVVREEMRMCPHKTAKVLAL